MQQPINEYESPVELMKAAAVAHAMAGEWTDAIRANQKLLAHDPDDVESHNRLGKALSAVGKVKDATSAYEAALRLDPHNRIARRNLTRLEQGVDGALANGAGAASEMMRATGSARGAAIVTRLQRPARPDAMEGVTEGDKLKLDASPAGVRVSTLSGKYLGVVNAKLSVRLARLVVKGNRYDAFAAGVEQDHISISIVETFKHPDMGNVVSFPVQFIERDDDDDELDKYGEGAASINDGGARLIDYSDDEEVETGGDNRLSVLSSEIEAPSL